MKPALLYFDRYQKEHAIGLHQAYCKQVREKIFPLSQNIEGEAEAFAEQEYERLGNMPSHGEDGDMSEIADIAQEHSIDYYMALDFAYQQITHSVFASLYHLWEKTLKVFIVREFTAHYVISEQDKRKLLRADFGDLTDLLQVSGYALTDSPFYDMLDTCRLVANTTKHGIGDSAKQLKEKEKACLRCSHEMRIGGG